MDEHSDSDRFPIGYAARMAGLTTHTIRMWERRYLAVRPDRTESNRRQYTRADIRRLALLKTLSERGHSLSMLSRYPIGDLERLERESSISEQDISKSSGAFAGDFLRLCQHAVNRTDTRELARVLEDALVQLSPATLLDDVLVPLVHWVGSCWEKGSLRVAQEHAATSVIQQFLASQHRSTAQNQRGPRIAISTLPGELHELGAQMAALTAHLQGWRVDYFGASLPAVELIAAARDNCADAVGISVVIPDEPQALVDELTRIRSAFEGSFPILVGGAGVRALASRIGPLRLLQHDSLSAMRQSLGKLRSAGIG